MQLLLCSQPTLWMFQLLWSPALQKHLQPMEVCSGHKRQPVANFAATTLANGEQNTGAIEWEYSRVSTGFTGSRVDVLDKRELQIFLCADDVANGFATAAIRAQSAHKKEGMVVLISQ